VRESLLGSEPEESLSDLEFETDNVLDGHGQLQTTEARPKGVKTNDRYCGLFQIVVNRKLLR
jgi:hypothetical protein